jgi:hypothetical protein
MNIYNDTENIKKIFETRPIFKAATDKQINKRPIPDNVVYINGYWVDDPKHPFKNYKCKLVDDVEIDSDEDQEIFYYFDGLEDLENLIDHPENAGSEFVVTSYTREPIYEAGPVFKPASPANIAKRDEDNRKLYSSDKVTTIDTEYTIGVGELIEDLMHQDYTEANAGEVDRMLVSKGLRYVRRQVMSEIQGLPIKLLDVKFNECDSGNYSHAVAYYEVILKGKIGALKQVCNEEGGSMYYEWPGDPGNRELL